MSADVLPPGHRLGKYEIVGHVATGGMGSVYRAVEDDTGREVAVKVLLPELAERPALLERFRREARTVGMLAHRNIVGVYDCGEDGGHHFLVMEFIEGFDLDDLIRRKGRFQPDEAVGVIMQATKALEHAFRVGIVHRDIKPSNFLLARTDKGLVVKMLDFGLARAEREEEFRVTRAGSTVGTIDYLSPEQARDAGAADVRSDIYSLGCTLYHMLAGHPPFPEGGLGERVFQHMNVEPPDVRSFNPAVTDDLWTVLRKMLEKKPNDRYQTPSELLQDLGRLKNGEPLRRNLSLAAADAGATPPPRPRSSATPVERPSDPEPAAPKQRRVIDDDPAVLKLSAADRRSAAARFEAAKTAAARGQVKDAVKLLMECCRLDPTVLAYRRVLRKLDPPEAGALGLLAERGRFFFATWTGNDRLALEAGESLIAAGGATAAVHCEMAEAADRLKLKQTALWIAEKGQQDFADDARLVKTFARMLEKARHLEQALVMWRVVERIDPEDLDAPRKITDLTATVSISRGKYSDSEIEEG